MGNYSYSEIQDMQRKAMERVREMKKNSDIVTQSAQRDFDEKPQNNDSVRMVTPKVTNMPPNFPEETTYPTFKAVFEEGKEKPHTEKQSEKMPLQENQRDPLETLFAEPDKALLLGLIMLLKSERADEGLIMALTYILS